MTEADVDRFQAVADGKGYGYVYQHDSPPTCAPSVLQEAEALIRGDRATEHGEAGETYKRVGIVWGALLGTDPIPTDRVLLMLSGMKLARASINPAVADNYVDAAGYACLSWENRGR